MSTLDHAVRLAEALIFASAEPVGAAALARLLPETIDVEPVLQELQARYAGRGVELAEVGGGWQFRTAADLAPMLTRVVPQPRRLPRAAMETLAVIAYHQPVTRAEIEAVRGASLGQATIDALLEAGLIEAEGPQGGAGPADAVGHDARLLLAVRPAQPARPAAARGFAGGAAGISAGFPTL